jgi:hypothetical protein
VARAGFGCVFRGRLSKSRVESADVAIREIKVSRIAQQQQHLNLPVLSC